MEKALDGLQALISGYDEDCGSFAPKKRAIQGATGKTSNRAQAEQG